MDKKVTLCFLTILLMTSCISLSDNFELVVEYQNADGLSTDSQVILNGLQIGHVKSLNVGQNNEILATLTFDKVYELPDDSKFTITKNVFGTGTVVIETGKSAIFMQSGQMIEGHLDEKENTIMKTGINIVDSFSGMLTKQDSILIELRRLNKNIEQLTKKK